MIKLIKALAAVVTFGMLNTCTGGIAGTVNPERIPEARQQIHQYLTAYVSMEKPEEFEAFLKLSDKVSIDKVVENTVYAYVNEIEFNNLLNSDTRFKIEEYPKNPTQPVLVAAD